MRRSAPAAGARAGMKLESDWKAAKGVVEDADEKLKKILTKAQMEELKKMRAEARGR